LSLRQKYLSILTQLAPAGAVGVSLALGAAAPAAASTAPTQVATGTVSDRLAAVRDAVSTIDGDKAANAKERVAWWGNGWNGWGWPNWHNWNNWGNWFRNW